ncbi:SDR family NAD(P)-dependent oxidoreductase [Rhodococcus aetherivorans]
MTSGIAGASLTGKCCIVTGGAQGIGRAVALAFAERGASGVVIADRNVARAEEVAEEVVERGARAWVIEADLSRPVEVVEVVPQAVEHMGALDVLVNNAGVVERSMTDRSRVDELDEDVWDFVFNVNVKAAWLMTKHAAPFLKQRTGSAIVNCASVSGLIGFAEAPAYCSSKGALIQLTRSSAVDLAPHTRVNVVCPGSTETPLRRGFLEQAPDREAAEKMMTAGSLLPRAALPQEVAELIVFLASGSASFINGSVMNVDGGSLAWRG